MAENKLVIAALAGGLLAAGMGAGGFLIGRGIENARVGDRTVTVRGFAERDVKADLAVMPLRFAAAGDVLSDVQANVDNNLAIVRRFLTQQGYTAAEVELGQLEVVDQYAREYQAQNVSARYSVAQTVIVRTNNVDRVLATTRNLDALLRQGVVLQDFRGPSYIFTKLNEVRPKMIGEATASARTGAAQFARDSQSKLGGIRSATQGSFEIFGRDSVAEESTQVFKRVRVVTTISYRLQ